MPVTASIAPTQSDVQKALGRFIIDVSGLPRAAVVAAQPNRVGEPKLSEFVVMTVMRWQRLRTNVDTLADSAFVGTISGQVLTVSEVLNDWTVPVGALLFGIGIPDGTMIGAQTSGLPGGVGTYAVTSDLELDQRTFSAGGKTIEIASEVTVQIDFHSADYTASAIAQTVAATLRDAYGVQFFADLEDPLNQIIPLYADDPQMRPFVNAESQFEWRLVSEVKLQVNQTLRVQQQFADAVALVLVSVDAVYPPIYGSDSLDFSVPGNSQYVPGGL